MKFIPVAAISSLQIASLLMGAASATSSLSSSSSSSSSSSTAVMAGANTRLSQKGVRSVLKNARRLEQQGDDANNGQQDMDEAEVEAFLMDYSMKFLTCVQDQEIYDADGYLHYGAVIIRLCPSGKCDDDKGCKSGYADFAVDVGTYVAAYMEDQADNMNWDDQFDADSYGQCTEYLQNDDEDGNEGSGAYIGPGCTEDGSSVRMAVFVDQYCSTPATESAFAQISDGWTLPYSDGGLVSTECTPCTDYNNGDQLREMCMDLYYEAPYRCEDDFDFSHYYYDSVTEIYRYGKDKTGCTPIELMQKQKNTLGGAKAADLIFAIFLLLVAVGGFAYYTIWWRKQKENLEKIDDDESTQAGDSAYQHHDDDDESRSEHRSGTYEAYTAPQPAGEMA